MKKKGKENKIKANLTMISNKIRGKKERWKKSEKKM